MPLVSRAEDIGAGVSSGLRARRRSGDSESKAEGETESEEEDNFRTVEIR